MPSNSLVVTGVCAIAMPPSLFTACTQRAVLPEPESTANGPLVLVAGQRAKEKNRSKALTRGTKGTIAAYH
jgi:hypothetical protein